MAHPTEAVAAGQIENVFADELAGVTEAALLASCALSLKRIADALEKLDPQAPVNAYGETLADAIQNAHVRGLRGISTYNR